MARIILGAYKIRYPLGGTMSNLLQWLLGFTRLGHDIYFVEKSGYLNSCYDPSKRSMSNDCSYGMKVIDKLLRQYELQSRWCYVDADNCYHGMSKEKVESIFKSADLFIEMGSHEAWLVESAEAKMRVLVDGDPGFSQIWMEQRLADGEDLPEYDFYYTVGQNIGTENSTAPTARKKWSWIFHPVIVDLFPFRFINLDAPFTTVMNWQSYQPVTYQGKTYGHKNMEFDKFINLPQLTQASVEIAVSGKNIPHQRLTDAGWGIRDAQEITISFESFQDYICSSMGEFTVCKNGFVETNSGWFSERSAAYLASGRPVVMQDTGFSDHLPCGNGLFAVRTAEEAAAAIEEIFGNYEKHSKWAREVAIEYLDTKKVLTRFIKELGI